MPYRNAVRRWLIVGIVLTAALAAAQDLATPSSEKPYPLYAALDLARIPWHNEAGPWGPRVALQAPAQPVTTRTVNVRTLAQFNAAASVDGRLINITASWPGNT